MQQTQRLLSIMARLRDPDQGCPWDSKQDFFSLVPYLLEETYEVIDAIEREDFDDLRDELGDLLLQIVFHAQVATEQSLFDFEAIAKSICDKLVRRHPHVFGDTRYETEQQRMQAWEAIKKEERFQKQPDNSQGFSLLDDIPAHQPALMQAAKIQQRAASQGFDWPELEPVFDKLDEELAELKEALESGDRQHIRDELGDVLFVVVNLARHIKVEPESALKAGNQKFTRRFQYMEVQLALQGKKMDDCSLQVLDALWDEAKLALQNDTQ